MRGTNFPDHHVQDQYLYSGGDDISACSSLLDEFLKLHTNADEKSRADGTTNGDELNLTIV